MTCDFSEDRLIVTAAAPAEIPADTEVAFTLTGFKNPIEAGYVDGFNGDGYYSLAIIYAVFSIASWFAAPIVSKIGPRFTLILGGSCYVLFTAQIIYPNDILLYGFSAIVGFGAAMIWVAKGNFLTLNSDENTMTRNSGIFWVMIMTSSLIGNTYIYFQFQGLVDIDKKTRTMEKKNIIYFRIIIKKKY